MMKNKKSPHSSNTFNWDVEPYSLSYELQFSINLPTPVWSTVYSGTANTADFNPGLSGSWLFRVRGINDEGAGTWSDELIVTR